MKHFSYIKPEDNKTSRKLKNITGQVFGRLTALEIAGKVIKGRRVWKCVCTCGNCKLAKLGDLTRGHVKSCGCLQKVPKGQSAKIHIFRSYEYAAKKRNIIFELTYKKALDFFVDNCYYCGDSPKKVRKIGSHTFKYNGIDRTDNNKGYIEGNMVTCCGDCNIAKRTLSVEEFLTLITKIYNHKVLPKEQ